MGKNILSIDDDEDILYTIQEIILHQGWTPLLARNFREAEHILTQYGNGRLDLILVDYHLPQHGTANSSHGAFSRSWRG